MLAPEPVNRAMCPLHSASLSGELKKGWETIYKCKDMGLLAFWSPTSKTPTLRPATMEKKTVVKRADQQCQHRWPTQTVGMVVYLYIRILLDVNVMRPSVAYSVLLHNL